MSDEKTRVLVVEDNSILRSAYTTKLSMEGFRVEAAADGAEALEKAEGFSPDLIVLDILMPKMNGIEFLERYGGRNGCKVIVFSNTSVPGMMQKAVELGAERVLTKSTVSPKDLVAQIRDVLDGS